MSYDEQHAADECAGCREYEQERIVAESRAGLLRTLKAVYGERSRSGVVFRGRQYVVREDGVTTESLVITNATFEVLG